MGPRKVHLTEEDRRRHRQERRRELRANWTEEELKHQKELARERNRRRRAVRAQASRERQLQRLQELQEKAAELVRWALGKPTLCDKCKDSTRNAQTATIPPLKGGVDVAVGTRRRADRKLCKSTQASLGPFMVDWWTDTADLEGLQDTGAHRRESTAPPAHGSSGRHEREQSPGVSAVHESRLDVEGPASGSSDESLDSTTFASTGPVGAAYSERGAEVAVHQTTLPTSVSKSVAIEFSETCPYMCAFCLTAFADARDLAGHVEVCPWPEPYLCGLCSKPCEDWKTTRAHMSAHVGSNLKCPFCHRRNYKLKYDLVHLHVMLHVTVRQFMCGLCRSTFPTKKALQSHHSVLRARGLSCRYSKRRTRKENVSGPRPAASTRR